MLMQTKQDANGKGLSRVQLRVLTAFEHELIGLKKRLESNLNNRTLDAALLTYGLRLCTLNVEVRACVFCPGAWDMTLCLEGATVVHVESGVQGSTSSTSTSSSAVAVSLYCQGYCCLSKV